MDILNYLITGLPIITEQVGTIHQPTIAEILSFQGGLEQFLLPLTLDLESIQDNAEEGSLLKSLKLFDLYFLKDEDNSYLMKNNQDKPMLGQLIKSLHLLYNTKDIKLFSNYQLIIIKNQYAITRDNFDTLVDITYKIFGMAKPEKEQAPVFKTERQRKLYEKIMYYRAKAEKKKQITFGDMINIVVHGSKCFIPYYEVNNLTYWQLTNSYKSILAIDSYENFMKYKVSYKFDVKEDREHWTKNLKLEKITI